jgi:DNA-binding SARP family transcriptional activator
MAEVHADDMATPLLVAAMKGDVGIRVLGPVEARAATGWLTAPPQQRLLLALLALQVGQVIPIGELIDAIWPEAPPASARASIQVMITRLRQILADLPGGAVERCGDGYRLVIEPSSIDVQQFRLLARAARGAPNAADAVGAFDEALALWRGPAMADVPATARIEAIRFALAEERLSAVQDRIGTLLAAGRDRQAAEELTGLIAAHPLSERLAGLLMVALQRCGRQADALQVFRDLRKRLSAELAIEPGRDLQTLHQQILAGDLLQPGSTGSFTAPAQQIGHDEEFVAVGDNPHPVPRQLPTGVAHFTGRTAELKVLDRLLDRADSADGTVAIASISGTAGVGKTSLALHWAHQIAHRFPDGQLYVNLQAFGPSDRPVNAADAIRSLLDALDVPKDSRPTAIEAQAALYRSVLADKRVLAVLDNASDEEQVRSLLPGAGGCLVIVTSRRRLAGLAAREGAMLLALDVMSQPEAVDLITERLGAEITATSPETANQLATLCGRLPLALSIAAVRAAENSNMDLAAFTAQMQDIHGRLDLLDVGERASSVRAVLSWSHHNLSQAAARMFCLLGVHPGPDISIGAAASLVGCQVTQAKRLLAELVSAQVITEHVPGRWAFHELLRAYASEQARSDQSGPDRDAAILRALDYYLHTAWSAAAMLRPGRDPAFPLSPPCAGALPERISDAGRAMAWYEAEHQVLPAVITWAAAAGFGSYAWRLRWALTDYLAMSGRSHEQVAGQHRALAAARPSRDTAGQQERTTA